jgi:hypothetical protein
MALFEDYSQSSPGVFGKKNFFAQNPSGRPGEEDWLMKLMAMLSKPTMQMEQLSPGLPQDQALAALLQYYQMANAADGTMIPSLGTLQRDAAAMGGVTSLSSGPPSPDNIGAMGDVQAMMDARRTGDMQMDEYAFLQNQRNKAMQQGGTYDYKGQHGEIAPADLSDPNTQLAALMGGVPIAEQQAMDLQNKEFDQRKYEAQALEKQNRINNLLMNLKYLTESLKTADLESQVGIREQIKAVTEQLMKEYAGEAGAAPAPGGDQGGVSAPATVKEPGSDKAWDFRLRDEISRLFRGRDDKKGPPVLLDEGRGGGLPKPMQQGGPLVVDPGILLGDKPATAPPKGLLIEPKQQPPGQQAVVDQIKASIGRGRSPYDATLEVLDLNPQFESMPAEAKRNIAARVADEAVGMDVRMLGENLGISSDNPSTAKFLQAVLQAKQTYPQDSWYSALLDVVNSNPEYLGTISQDQIRQWAQRLDNA